MARYDGGKTLARRALPMTILASLALATGGCAAGVDGVDGTNGAQGPAGPVGASGQNGDDGRDGRDGRDGQDGRDGVDGSDGQDGDDGQDGQDGRNGNGARSLQFEDVGFPWTNAEKHQVRASKSVIVDGERHDLGFDVIIRSGKDPRIATNMTSGELECDLEGAPERCFGVLLDKNYEPILDGAGAPLVENNNDFTSLLQVGSGLFAVSSIETNPSAMYVTKVLQHAGGELEAEWTKAIDLAPIDGMWFSCAGSITPWNTHLASEEYPPDAKAIGAATVDFATYQASSQKGNLDNASKFQALHPLTADNFAEFQQAYSPYFHGFPVEVILDGAGNPTLRKHYAMGRVALELAYVMPDRRTAYLTDDGGNVGLFMFIADREGDLSSGRLFAARVYQTSPPGGAELTGDVQWIDLGHATDAEIRGLVHPKAGPRLAFEDLFETEPVVADACPTDGFTLIRAGGGSLECLKLREGMATAASRLETRRYAAYLGATTEFNKEEGITFDPDRGRLYLAMSDVSGALGAQPAIDHLNTAANRCGVVYALDVAPLVDLDGQLVSEYVAQNLYPFVSGVQTSYPDDSPYAGNSCSVNGIANPDNVTYLPGYDVLVIGEDTGRHQNDAVWAMNVVDRKMTRIFTTPYGAETTSPYWIPDVGGHGYLMSVVQHAYDESDRDRAGDAEATGSASWMGVIGPFPSLSLD